MKKIPKITLLLMAIISWFLVDIFITETCSSSRIFPKETIVISREGCICLFDYNAFLIDLNKFCEDFAFKCFDNIDQSLVQTFQNNMSCFFDAKKFDRLVNEKYLDLSFLVDPVNLTFSN